MLSKLIKDAQKKGLITIQKTGLSELQEAVRRKVKQQAETERALQILNEFARTMRPLNIFTQTRPTVALETVDFSTN